MRQCESCGAEVGAGEAICPRCGHDVTGRGQARGGVLGPPRGPGHNTATLGAASLWTSVAGFVLPVCMAVLGLRLARPGGRMGPSDEETNVVLLCLGLFVTLELVALGCGIAARRTAAGKAGLVISGIPLGVAVHGHLAK